MMLVSGVSFPLEELPEAVATGAMLPSLAHVVALVRPLMTGWWPDLVLLHLSVIIAYASAGYWISAALARRRLTA